MKLLFIGDSITDAGRTTGEGELGNGYVQKIKKYLTLFHKETPYSVINKGINGNEAVDLRTRWNEDCIQLQPDLISILVGINDCGRRYDENRPTSAEQFEAAYRELLQNALESLPQVKLVLMEPYLLDALPEQRVWREDLDQKRLVIQRLAREFQTVFLPLDGIFALASTKKQPAYWAEDGVHPSEAGHSLIALEWLKTTGLL